MNTLAQQMHTPLLRLPDNSEQAHNNLPYLRKGGVLTLVLLAHAGILIAIISNKISATIIETPKPITVSLIAAAPIIDITPVKPKEQPKQIVEPKKVTPKIPKEKITPKPIKPIEKPAEIIQETVTEPAETPPLEPAPTIKEETAPTVAEESTPADVTPKAVEENIDPPKFGVAYLNNPAPVYPALARRAGEHGRVLLRVLVSSKGEAETVEIETGSGSRRLDEAATDAVKRWRFVPARKGGVALSAYVLVPIKFSLEK